MKIGLYQSEIAWENKEENYSKVQKVLADNKDVQLDAVFLPEMSFTGFSMDTQKNGEFDNRTIEKMRILAKDNNTAIGFGWIKGTSKGENRYTVVDKNGNVISDYVKIHPFSYADEDKYYLSGNRMSFFEISDIRMSTLICYDLRFPDLFSIAARKTDLIVVPANWPSARRDHWKTLLQARAIENQVYIAGINCVGDIGGVYYSGDSCIIDPNGKTLIMGEKEEKLLIADIDSDIDDYRNRFPTVRDRRTKLYRELADLYDGE